MEVNTLRTQIITLGLWPMAVQIAQADDMDYDEAPDYVRKALVDLSWEELAVNANEYATG